MALNANRHVTGVLRGFDQFMNIVLDNAVDEKNKTDIGMVVRLLPWQEHCYGHCTSELHLRTESPAEALIRHVDIQRHSAIELLLSSVKRRKRVIGPAGAALCILIHMDYRIT